MAQVTFYVKQYKEMIEAVLGFETSNKYSITDSSGNLIADAQESSNWLGRQFLRALRPFEMNVTGANSHKLMTLDKGFAFMLHRIEVRDSIGKYVGAVQRTFSFFTRDYVIEDSAHRTLFQIAGPIWSPWTFNIMQNGVQKGVIKKKWSGFFKESFTDADNFSVTCPQEWEGKVKQLLLAAVLLIDFVHFEN